MSKLASLLMAATLIAATNYNLDALTPPACDRALVRQAPHTESLLTDSTQKMMSVKHGKGVKTVALESLGKTGASMVGGPAAAIAMPYMETGAAKAAHFGKELVTRHGTNAVRIEFDTLTGTTAGVSLRPGNIEILVPVNQYITSAEALEDIRPVLVKLDVNLKDQVRIIAARHVELRQEKKSRFDLRPAVTRIEHEVTEMVVPSSFERLPENVYRIVNSEPLGPGEYALVFRRKAVSGQYTTNVALRGTTPESQTRDSSGSSLSDLMNPANRSNTLTVVATNSIAFDFRVLP